MTRYIPFHERPPFFAVPPEPSRPGASFPEYGLPDLDLSVSYPWYRPAMSSSEPEGQSYESRPAAGPSRKRARTDENGNGQGDSEFEPQHHHGPPPIPPSIFNIAPRNDLTRMIGDFIMLNARDKDNIEIEIKLGTLYAAGHPGEQPRRVRLPARTETVVPPDYPVGRFASNMVKEQNQSLNRLLNSAVEESQQWAYPIKFFRARQIDSFYNVASSQRGTSKVRVSRDMKTGEIIPGGVVKKRRVSDMNVYFPNGAFDWRISVSIEEPTEEPEGRPALSREKDRACYRHELCQVDLTVVGMKASENAPPSYTYELEIEVLDAPALIAEGLKEEAGLPNRFDEILQSCLDTARMLIRNVG